MSTTTVHCVPSLAGVQLRVALFNAGANDREGLLGHLATFRPQFADVSCIRDGDLKETVCVATLPSEADRDEIVKAQKAFMVVMSEFFPDSDIELVDQVLH